LRRNLLPPFLGKTLNCTGNRLSNIDKRGHNPGQDEVFKLRSSSYKNGGRHVPEDFHFSANCNKETSSVMSRSVDWYLPTFRDNLSVPSSRAKHFFFVNKQLDALLFPCVFIYILYMFRAAMCPSSGELIVSIRHLVNVTLYFFLWRCDPTRFMASSFLRFSISHIMTFHSR